MCMPHGSKHIISTAEYTVHQLIDLSLQMQTTHSFGNDFSAQSQTLMSLTNLWKK